MRGGVVAYATELKHSLLGVDADLLAASERSTRRSRGRWPRACATALAVDGAPADVGISTTGVAGPDPQDGQPVGTVFVGIAIGEAESTRYHLALGDRSEHPRRRSSASTAALSELARSARETGRE